MSRWAFLGAGEFEEWHDDVDRTLLAGRDGRVLVLATAAAREGDQVFDRWTAQGIAHYRRLGAEVSAPALKRPEDAHDERIIGMLDDASLVFFSGGNPAYLAEVLRDSPFWARLRERVVEGSTAYAGCSAGVACLSDPTYDSDTDDFERVWAPGLGHFPGVLFGPHWDVVDTWIPGAQAFITASTPEGGTLVALDERTAMTGDGEAWAVHGAGAVHVYEDGGWSDHAAGDRFTLVLPTTEEGS
jgi:cyanophycinase